MVKKNKLFKPTAFCDEMFDDPIHTWEIGEQRLITIKEFLDKRNEYGMASYRYADNEIILGNMRSTIANYLRRHSPPETGVIIRQTKEKNGLRIWRIE